MIVRSYHVSYTIRSHILETSLSVLLGLKSHTDLLFSRCCRRITILLQLCSTYNTGRFWNNFFHLIWHQHRMINVLLIDLFLGSYADIKFISKKHWLNKHTSSQDNVSVSRHSVGWMPFIFYSILFLSPYLHYWFVMVAKVMNKLPCGEWIAPFWKTSSITGSWIEKVVTFVYSSDSINLKTFNSLVPGRCAGDFKNILFKFAIQKSNSSTCCKIAFFIMTQDLVND